MFLEFRPGIRTALADGTLVPDSPKHMATEFVYFAEKGARIRLAAGEAKWQFAVALFSAKREERYMYTYVYQKESNWTTYTRNLKPDSYGTEEFVFEESFYFRVCIKRSDGADICGEDIEEKDRLVEFIPAAWREERQPKVWFDEEIVRTAEEIERLRSSDSVVLGLLGDTHYAVNGTWEDTAYTLREVHRRAAFDAIVHLGDLTDGMVSKRVTKEYAGRVLTDLYACGVPVYIATGNHDMNYFGGNPDRLSVEEQLAVYGGSAPERTAPWYYVDAAPDLRLLFLTCFCADERIRYGFDEEELQWVEDTLRRTPEGCSLIIFCHDAPLAELDYWSFTIRNGDRLLEILEAYNGQRGGHRIMGYFHGHAHADHICTDAGFPIVSVGCAKCEYFEEKKPPGFTVFERKPDTVTQELWDTMVIDRKREKIHLVRFGAGEDRTVTCGGNRGRWKEIRKKRNADRKMRKIKIWAHRGLSGHAPENTVPAFELAAEAGADGVELDVQLTRDGVPVVLHDERIDRTSDGTGFVKDYTLEELRKYNFARNYPNFGTVRIPTLQEVYEVLRDTGMSVNVELKNSVIFQEGLEEKILKLAEEMGMKDRILYSSFNHYSMKRIKELDREAKTAFLYADGILDMAEYAKNYGAFAVHPSFVNLQYPGLVEECHKLGIRVHVWTVNEEQDMERAVRMGVDALITNYPERAAAVLEKEAIKG